MPLQPHLGGGKGLAQLVVAAVTGVGAGQGLGKGVTA